MVRPLSVEWETAKRKTKKTAGLCLFVLFSTWCKSYALKRFLHYRSFTKCHCPFCHSSSLKPLSLLQQDDSCVSELVLIFKHTYRCVSLWTMAQSSVAGEMKLKIQFLIIILFTSKERGVPHPSEMSSLDCGPIIFFTSSRCEVHKMISSSFFSF